VINRLIISVLIALPLHLVGQVNLHTIQNQHTSNTAASYFPSMLGNDCKFFELDILNVNVGAGNSLLSLYNLEQLGAAGANEQALLNRKLERARKRNTLYLGTDLNLLNTAIRVPLKNNTIVRGGFGVRQRNEFQFTLDKNMLSLLLNGNKRFAGQPINLLPSVNFLSLLDYHFTGSYEFNSSRLGGRRLTTAVTLHRLTGLANFRSRESKLEFYTAPDGRYIEVDAQLEVNTSSLANSTDDANNGIGDLPIGDLVRKGCGKGWGIDLGASLDLTSNIELHAALIDLGFIRFNDLSTTYSGDQTLRFEGVEVEGIYNPTISTDLDGDTLSDLFKLDETKGEYTVGMPTKLLLCGQWHSPVIEKNRVRYSMHTASACIVQGFRNYLSSSPKPALNLGYTLSAGNILNIGVNTTVGGIYGGMSGGGFISLRGSVVKLTLGSNNLAPLLFSRAGRFTDAYFGLSVLY
jgi:hypothetical protein